MSYNFDGYGKTEREFFDFFNNLVFSKPDYITNEFDYDLPEETPVYISDINYYKSFFINVSDDWFERVIDSVFNEDVCKKVNLGHRQGYVFYDDLYY